MSTRVLGNADVHALLDMPGLIGAMERALQEVSRGAAAMPARSVLPLPRADGVLAWMPAVLEGEALFGGKAITVYPENRTRGVHAHQGVVLLFSPADGALRAILDADAVTARRTAAVSAVATRALALPGAGDLALIGCGPQSAAHLEAIAHVRDLRRVRFCSRDPRHAEDFARRMAGRVGCGVEAVADPEQAIRGADIVCTLTDARSPVLQGSWLRSGAHVNAVGASVPGFREIAEDAVRRARIYVDALEPCLAQADDLRLPIADGSLDRAAVLGEIGDVTLGRLAGRTSSEDVTLFESVGLAAEDVAAACYAVERAEARGIGTLLEIGAA